MVFWITKKWFEILFRTKVEKVCYNNYIQSLAFLSQVAIPFKTMFFKLYSTRAKKHSALYGFKFF